MIQLKILSGSTAGTELVARRFPIVVGRNSCNLQVSDPGIWDNHFQIDLGKENQIYVSTNPDTTVVLNGQSLQNAVLRNGEIIEIGSTKILFGFSATKQRGLALREWLTWTAIVSLCVGQIVLIYKLIR